VGNDWGFHTFMTLGPKYLKGALGFNVEKVSYIYTWSENGSHWYVYTRISEVPKEWGASGFLGWGGAHVFYMKNYFKRNMEEHF
jgi:hypothetical protein